jgi:hypothetical protein
MVGMDPKKYQIAPYGSNRSVENTRLELVCNTFFRFLDAGSLRCPTNRVSFGLSEAKVGGSADGCGIVFAHPDPSPRLKLGESSARNFMRTPFGPKELMEGLRSGSSVCFNELGSFVRLF